MPPDPFGPYVPDVSYHPWGLGSGYTAPVAAVDETASSIVSRCAVAAGAGAGSRGTRGGGARMNSGCPNVVC